MLLGLQVLHIEKHEIGALPHASHKNQSQVARDFPGGAVPANAGDTGLSPGLGRSHMPRSN